MSTRTERVLKVVAPWLMFLSSTYFCVYNALSSNIDMAVLWFCCWVYAFMLIVVFPED